MSCSGRCVNHPVTPCRFGQSAVAMLVSETPHIFTLDHGASGYYGYEVMDTCRPIPDSEAGNADPVPQQHAKQTDDGDASQKSFFLRDDGEDEVVVGDRRGQVAQLGLRALGPALAGKPARANRDERLAAVPADAHRVHLVGQRKGQGNALLARLLIADGKATDMAGAAAYTRSVKIVGQGRGGKDREEVLEIRSLNNARGSRGRKGKQADLGFKPLSVVRVE